jgi:hypothetical protein
MNATAIGIVAVLVTSGIAIIVICALILTRKKKGVTTNAPVGEGVKAAPPSKNGSVPHASTPGVKGLFEQAGVPRPLEIGKRIKDERHIE